MKKNRKAVSKNEMMKGKMEKDKIMLEKDYTEQCSEWMAERLEALIEYMQYGHAAVAYMKQDGTFKLVKGTLVGSKKISESSMIRWNKKHSGLPGCGATKVDDLQNREFHGMESDRIGESFSDQLISNITT